LRHIYVLSGWQKVTERNIYQLWLTSSDIAPHSAPIDRSYGWFDARNFRSEHRLNCPMRKIIGSLILVIGLVIYIVVMATIGGMIALSPWYVQLPFYAIAGVAWALPLRPLLNWIHAKDNP
jgi:hypothetical protein